MVTILTGDCRDVLPTLPDASVNCCVTSPPYWGLRDYGTAKWEGGDPACDHLRPRMGGNGDKSPINGMGSDRDESVGLQQYRDICRKCGARRIDSQIGLEQSPEAYVAELVAVFREVWRVLRDDGTLWLNLGDSYNAYNGNRGRSTSFQAATDEALPDLPGGAGLTCKELKPKDIVGIPWRVAFALQADGWYLRQDIIWHKPNPMPESVTDRCTKAHEYIFLLSKSARYYYDAEAIKEPAADPAREKRCEGENAYRGQAAIRPRGATRRHRKPAGWDTGAGAHGTIHRDGRAKEVEYTETEATNRNKRSVWTIPTAPYSGAHFATFPPALIRPCILAGCPVGGTVLDPFGGSGTTGQVAEEEGRNSIVVELNAEYVELAKKRTAQGGLFCAPSVTP